MTVSAGCFGIPLFYLKTVYKYDRQMSCSCGIIGEKGKAELLEPEELCRELGALAEALAVQYKRRD